MKPIAILFAVLFVFFSMHGASFAQDTIESSVIINQDAYRSEGHQNKNKEKNDAYSASKQLQEPGENISDARQTAAIENATLRIITWDGAYRKAQEKTIFQSFEKDQNLRLAIKNRSSLSQDMLVALNSKKSTIDILDLTYHETEQACQKDLLKPIDKAKLNISKNSNTTEEDLIDKAVHKCGVASTLWSSVIVFHKAFFKRKRRPSSLKDFFNVKRYPGKRALPNKPERVLEFALMATGVKPNNIYSTLEGEQGIQKAFDQLNKIKKHIIWWSDATEPYKLLKARKVTMAMGYSGRAFANIMQEKHPYQIIWDGQIYEMNMWAISAKSKLENPALKFIAHATSAKQLAGFSQWFPYGPVRKSAFQYIKTHPETGASLKEFIPTYPDNFKTALHYEGAWWKENKKKLDLEKRFSAWIANETYVKPASAQEQANKAPKKEGNATAQNENQPR
ncbi:MAG: extracellular solute-binding protein [Pseudomonadota bacterium]